MDDTREILSRAAATVAGMRDLYPLQAAFDAALDDWIELHRRRLPWSRVAAALAAAGVRSASGDLVGPEYCGRLYSTAMSRRRQAEWKRAAEKAPEPHRPRGGDSQGAAPPDTPAVKGGAPLNNPPGMPEGVGTETAFQRVQRERAERDARQAGKPSLDPWDK